MAPDVQSDHRGRSESAASQAPQNGSSAVLTANGSGSISLVRKGTGPRTKQGKGRSKLNAITHGILSKVVVLKGESPDEFDALLSGLRNDFRPVGTFEEVLVEKLAAQFWRHRRLLIAESAEIQASSEFVEWDGQERQRQEAATIPQLSCNGGLTRRTTNPEALQGCLDLLAELKEGIEENGFDPQHDKVILTKLYGDYDGEEAWQKTLCNSYDAWLNTSLVSDDERRQKGYASPQESRDNFLGELNKEIRRLGEYKKEQKTILSAKSKLESLRQSVPYAPQLDRLLRYEATLERSIERTLNQLERTQRMRQGQPVPPPLNLNVTAL